MTNIFGFHTQPCKTTRYNIKLMYMFGKEKDQKLKSLKTFETLA